MFTRQYTQLHEKVHLGLTGTLASSMTYLPPKPTPLLAHYPTDDRYIPTVGFISKDIVDQSGVPDGFLDRRAVVPCQLADIVRLSCGVEHVRQVGQLDAQHGISGRQEGFQRQEINF